MEMHHHHGNNNIVARDYFSCDFHSSIHADKIINVRRYNQRNSADDNNNNTSTANINTYNNNDHNNHNHRQGQRQRQLLHITTHKKNAVNHSLTCCEFIIKTLQGDLATKNERIESLEERLVEMALELASAKALQDHCRLLVQQQQIRTTATDGNKVQPEAGGRTRDNVEYDDNATATVLAHHHDDDVISVSGGKRNI